MVRRESLRQTPFGLMKHSSPLVPSLAAASYLLTIVRAPASGGIGDGRKLALTPLALQTVSEPALAFN